MQKCNQTMTQSCQITTYSSNQSNDSYFQHTNVSEDHPLTPSDADGDIHVRLTGLIDEDTRKKLEIVFQISLFTISSLIGSAANSINIAVYWKQGLKDSITVGLFALSVSDFFVVFFPLFTAAGYMADHFLPNSPIQYVAVAGVSATQARHLAYSISCTLLAFLSIERCFCVIRPFAVKLIFTRKRTIIAVISVVTFYVFAFIPMFATHQLRWQVIPSRNFTHRFTLWYHPFANDVRAYNSSVMSITVPIVAQVIVTCAAIIMIGGLRKASKFRQSATADKNAVTPSDNGEIKELQVDERTGQKKEQVVLGSRDARLVKTMLILVAILSAANVPYICLMFTQQIVPELNARKRFANTFRLMSSINFFLGSLNASVNAVVYYFTSTRYREIAYGLFCRDNCQG